MDVFVPLHSSIRITFIKLHYIPCGEIWKNIDLSLLSVALINVPNTDIHSIRESGVEYEYNPTPSFTIWRDQPLF